MSRSRPRPSSERRQKPSSRPSSKAAPLAAARFHLDGSVKAALETSRSRLFFTATMFLIGFCAIAVRVVDLTILQPGYEPALATAPLEGGRPSERAEIVDRNGVLLATSLGTASLYADPQKILDAADAATRLVKSLPGLDRQLILARLESDRRFVWLQRNLTPRQQYEVNRLGIPGLYFQREERRIYPYGRVAAHVVGFTGIDNHGLAGIEKFHDTALRKTDTPLVLSLDIRVQHIVHEELLATVQRFEAAGAAGIMMDADNGEILAMVSLPDFDPNQPLAADNPAGFNRATLALFEMGSTFKPLTAAMALETGVTTLSGGYDASEPIRVGRHYIRDYRPKNRWLSVPEILIHSSNIGAAKMALDVGATRQRQFFERLGLTRPVHVEIAETGVPLMPPVWREVNTMTAAFGYGIAVSPLHMTSAIAAVVNGGLFYNPTLMKQEDGSSQVASRVFSAKTSAAMRALMRLVVTEGTGGNAESPGYLVGGKTGTAEKSGDAGYSKKLVSSFIGAFPMSAPRYVIAVVVDEPKGRQDTFGYATGGWVSAPAVGHIITRAGPLLGIAPTGGDGSDNEIWANAHAEAPELAAYRLDD